MELSINNLTHVANATTESDNARYEVGYTVLEQNSNKQLCSVTAKVFAKKTVEVPALQDVDSEDTTTAEATTTTQVIEEYRGTLELSYGAFNAAKFPYSAELQVYMSDFNQIVTEVTNMYITNNN